VIAHDHDAIRQMGRDLAKKLGVTPTPPAGDTSAKTQAEVMASLRAKHGADFDQAFLEHDVAFRPFNRTWWRRSGSSGNCTRLGRRPRSREPRANDIAAPPRRQSRTKLSSPADAGA
jgi:hypothetical protein